MSKQDRNVTQQTNVFLIFPSLIITLSSLPLFPLQGGLASAGHVTAVPAVVAARVHPGVQGQLPGPERRLGPAGEWLLRRGRRVLRRARRNAHGRAAARQ